MSAPVQLLTHRIPPLQADFPYQQGQGGNLLACHALDPCSQSHVDIQDSSSKKPNVYEEKSAVC